MLGTESLWRPWSHRREGRASASSPRPSASGSRVDPDARVATLSVGERQRVEILKALYRDARVLILDEPTAVLTPQESGVAVRHAARPRAPTGSSIIFISHKLDEVLRVSDRIAVLRAGKLVATMRGGRHVEGATLAELMVGRDVPPPVGEAARARRHRVRCSTTSSCKASATPSACTTCRCRCARARSPRSPACRATARPRSSTSCAACAQPTREASRSAAARCRGARARGSPPASRAFPRTGATVGLDRSTAAVGERDRRALPHAASRARASCGAARRASLRAEAVRPLRRARRRHRRAGALAVGRQHAEADPRPRAVRRRRARGRATCRC